MQVMAAANPNQPQQPHNPFLGDPNPGARAPTDNQVQLSERKICTYINVDTNKQYVNVPDSCCPVYMLIDIFGADYMRAHLRGRQLNLQPNNQTLQRNFRAFCRIPGAIPQGPLTPYDNTPYMQLAPLQNPSSRAVINAVTDALSFALDLTGNIQNPLVEYEVSH